MSSLILAAATPYGLHEVCVPVRTYYIHGGLYAPVAREVYTISTFGVDLPFLGVKAPGGQGWLPLVLEMTKIQISTHLSHIRCFMALWGDTHMVAIFIKRCKI